MDVPWKRWLTVTLWASVIAVARCWERCRAVLAARVEVEPTKSLEYGVVVAVEGGGSTIRRLFIFNPMNLGLVALLSGSETRSKSMPSESWV